MPAPGTSRFTKHLPAIEEMIEAGIPTHYIAEALGDSRVAVSNYLNMHGLLALREERHKATVQDIAAKHGLARTEGKGERNDKR